jgi:hypothetical protein
MLIGLTSVVGFAHGADGLIKFVDPVGPQGGLADETQPTGKRAAAGVDSSTDSSTAGVFGAGGLETGAKASPAPVSMQLGDAPESNGANHLSSDRPPSVSKPRPVVVRLSDVEADERFGSSNRMAGFDSRVRIRLGDATALPINEEMNAAASDERASLMGILDIGSQPLEMEITREWSGQELTDYRLSTSVPSLIVLAEPPPDATFEELATLQADSPALLDEGFKPIAAVGADIRVDVGELPTDLAGAQFARVGEIHQTMGASRDWGLYSFTWEAKGLCHGPLRFEQPNLERYGYSLGVVQPVVSAAHFFSTMPLLPYHMTTDRARECQYTLGHYRPGSYAPFRRSRIPLRLDAAAVQGWVTTGVFFLVP